MPDRNIFVIAVVGSIVTSTASIYYNSGGLVSFLYCNLYLTWTGCLQNVGFEHNLRKKVAKRRRLQPHITDPQDSEDTATNQQSQLSNEVIQQVNKAVTEATAANTPSQLSNEMIEQINTAVQEAIKNQSSPVVSETNPPPPIQFVSEVRTKQSKQTI